MFLDDPQLETGKGGRKSLWTSSHPSFCRIGWWVQENEPGSLLEQPSASRDFAREVRRQFLLLLAKDKFQSCRDEATRLEKQTVPFPEV